MSGTSVPALNLYTPGQAVFSASWANGIVQSGAFLADLRSFSGVPNMTVQLIGFTAQGDGGQGMFVWSTNAGTDDGGVTCVVPNGVTQGCWLRQLPGYVVPSSAFSGFSTLVGSVANIAALRAATTTSLTPGQVLVDGYFTGADGGGGLFWYNSTDTTTADNSGTIIVDASSRRWYRVVQDAAFNLDWFGGTATTADCSSAIKLALAAMKGPGGTVVISGARSFGSEIDFTFPSGRFSLTVQGIGAEASSMTWAGTNGFTCFASNPAHTVHFRDISIVTSSSLGFSGVTLNNSVQGGIFGQNDFTRVTFRGADGGGASNGWTTALSVVGWGNITYETCLFYGNSTANGTTGLSVAGVPTGGFKYSLIHNLSNCGFFNLGIGFSYGTYVQGVQIVNCNFTNGTTDVYLPTGGAAAAQLSIVNSQFAGLGSRIVINAPIAGILISNNLIFVAANQIGIAINATWGQVEITGNIFSGQSLTGSFGLVVAATGYTAIATGNCFFGLGAGISLQGATTGGWIVALNNYSGSTNTVENIGTNSVGVITQ